MTTSAIACEMRVISRSLPSGSTFLPYFSSRAAHREQVRVAHPLAVPVGRALHVRGARVDRGEGVRDGAPRVVLCVDAEPGPVSARTVDTTAWTCAGSIPPLVSQRMTTSAPASDAARTTAFAYSGLAR